MFQKILLLLLLCAAIPARAQFTPPVMIKDFHYDYYQKAAYDWDYDGDLDFLALSYTTSGSFLFLIENLGSGQLAPPVPLGVNTNYVDFKMTDLNGDGLTDLIVHVSNPGNGLELRFQTAGGQFSAPAMTWTQISDLALVDLDGDGDTDVVTLEPMLQWYKNDGQGHLDLPRFIADPPGNLLHPMDMNADGKIDLLVTNVSTGKVNYFQNLGNDNFKPKVLVATLSNHLCKLSSADLDNDGLPDLLPLNCDNVGQDWLRNTGNDLFENQKPLDPLAGWLHPLYEHVTGDLDGDGDTDVLGYMQTDSLVWFENTGNGQFSTHLQAKQGEIGQLFDLALTDFDADGKLDLVSAAYYRGLVFFKNQGGGQFAPRKFVAPEMLSVAEVKLADLNQDGLRDMLVASPDDGKLAWYPGLGGGQFGNQQFVSDINYNGIFAHAIDVDNDGDLDVLSGTIRRALIGNSQYELVWYKNDGAGHFGTAISVFPNGGYFPVINATVVDLDGDGWKDILCNSLVAYITPAWFHNNGDGTFGFPQFILHPQMLGTANLIDIDGDLDKDLVFPKGLNLYWNANDGHGNFSSTANLIGPSSVDYPGCLLSADLDSDGDLDVITSRKTWFPNLGDGTFGPEQQHDGTMYPIEITDLNHDGKPDIIGNENTFFGWQPNVGGGKLSAQIVLNINPDNVFQNVQSADFDGNGNKVILFSTNQQIGYAGDLGGLPSVSGYCFWDKNENGVRDSTETALSGIRCNLDGATQFSYSDAEGRFRFYTLPGMHQLSYIAETCWELTTDSSVWQLNLADTAVMNVNFGFKLKPGVPALETKISSGPTICGQSVSFWMGLFNQRCASNSGRCSFVLDPNVSLNFADPVPDLVMGDTLFWEIDTLEPGASRDLYLSVNMTGASIGSDLHFKGTVETYGDDGISVVYRDSTEYKSTLLCSFDPNDKTVDLRELAPDYKADSSEMTYTIRFQNTGNYLAFNIRIRDTLNAGLDWATLRPLHASHAFYTNLDLEKGIVEFTFPNILLPDSLSDEAQSHGFVSFRIRPKPNLPQGAVIPNRADIYFDFNAPVRTDYAETRVKQIIAVRPESDTDDWVSLAPNPATALVNLSFKQAMGHARLRVCDMQGRVVMMQQLELAEPNASIDVSALPPAAYLLSITTENGKGYNAVLIVGK